MEGRWEVIETTQHTGAELIKIYWEAFKGFDPEAAAISAVAEAVRDVLLSQLKAKDERIAVLEAFVRAFDGWWGTNPNTDDEDDAETAIVAYRELVGKVGGK